LGLNAFCSSAELWYNWQQRSKYERQVSQVKQNTEFITSDSRLEEQTCIAANSSPLCMYFLSFEDEEPIAAGVSSETKNRPAHPTAEDTNENTPSRSHATRRFTPKNH
jgi:hypothetical protein